MAISKRNPTCSVGLLVLFISVLAGGCRSEVLTGLDRPDQLRPLLGGKRVGIVTNHTARDRQGRHIVDILVDTPDVNVTALFAPEHGIYGLADAGEKIADGLDPRHGLPVRSLYGRTRKPTAAMLADVDVLVFDIQDIGARFYTYIYTMALAMEAAAEKGIPFVVLDRPNPINGRAVEGPILDPNYASFVGMYPMPVRHGMTAGELARMFNGEHWLAGGVQADLTVVPMLNWRRGMWYDQTGLPWIKPSPNMPDLETAIVYPGLCLLEGTNISEGRGTDAPFLQFGAPWLDPAQLTERLNALNIPGARFEPAAFTPASSKHADQQCHGCRISVTDRDIFEPFFAGVQIIDVLYRISGDKFQWRPDHFDRLCGTDEIRNAIIEGRSLESLRLRWQSQIADFQSTRQQYFLYSHPVTP